MTIKRKVIFLYRRLLKATTKWRGGDVLSGKIDAVGLDAVIKQNRMALNLVQDWFPPGLVSQSVFRYGVNPGLEQLLNLPLDQECIHADILAYFGRTAKEPGRYLELGVSVGKTFWQILNTCKPMECWGFDIEEINPVLKSRLVEQSRQEWQGPPDSIKKTKSSISRFLHAATGNSVVYICADIFDTKAWELLAGKKFNLVLSDALHTPEALEFEWRQMTSMAIFNPREAVVMWDDLDGEMHSWFKAKTSSIVGHFGIDPAEVGTLYLNGWLGRREFPHRLGLAIHKSARS